MKVQFRVDTAAPEATASSILRLLEQELVEAKPSSLERTENTLTVRGGFLRRVSNWNLLGPFTRATFTVVVEPRSVLILLDATLTQLLVVCSIASLQFTMFSLLSRSYAVTLVVGVALPWGWLFGVNYLVGRTRMSRLLKRVARAARDAA